MANNQWVADPNDPNRMTYTDEQGNVHVAVRDTGAQVQRDKSGNVTDVTFPNYRPPAKDPLAERLMQEQTPEYLERVRSEGSHRPVLGQEPLPGAGRLANAYKQLMTPGIDDESLRWLGRRDYYKDTPGNFLRNLLVAAENAPGRSISSALSGLNALGELTRYTPIEGLMEAFPLGGAEIGGFRPSVNKIAPKEVAEPIAPVPERYVIPVEDRAGIEDMLRSGASLDDIKAKYPRAVFGNNGTTLQWYINNRGKWKKVNWTSDKSTLDLKADQAIGPNGESVNVSPQPDTDFNGNGFRDYRAVDAEGNVLHEGRIYDDGQVIGQRPDGSWVDDTPTADLVRFRSKTTERLDNLAEGQPVDPTKSVGAPENLDPELAAKFDEEFGSEKPSTLSSLHEKRMQDIQTILANPETASMKEISDAIDYLDEAYAQGLDVSKVQDDLMKLEEYRYQKASPQNDNTPESLADKAIRHEDDYVKLAFHDERRFLEDTNSPEYKQWEKEVDEAERKAFESAKEQLRAEDPSYVDTIVEQNKGMAGPYRDAARAVAEENAAKAVPSEEAPVLDHAEPDPPVLDHAEPAAIKAEDVFNKLSNAIRIAGKISDEQIALNAATRKEKAAALGKARHSAEGIDGLKAESAALKGEYPKIERPSVEHLITQEEVMAALTYIKYHPDLGWFESYRARLAFTKLLSGERLPPADISLLARVVPKELTQTVLKARSRSDLFKHVLGEAVNLPRALRSSMDLSVLLRQAWNLTTRKEFYKNIPSMFKQAFSEKEFQNVMREIRQRPNYEKMVNSKLSFSDLSHDLNTREEAFMSNWAEKVPFVRASERGFTGFLNKLRADVFDDIYRQAAKIGKDVDDPKFLDSLSNYINNATGRGSLGKFESAGPFLNGLLFSPRLMSARLALMPINIPYYASLDPFVRKQAIRDMLGASALSITALTLAAAGGLGVEVDPRSSDFGKIRDGNDRHDILGGFGQYVTFFSRLATNKTMNSKGILTEMGEGRFSKTRLDAVEAFFRSKASPVAGYIGDYLDKQNIIGEPFDAKKNTLQLFAPMFLSDVVKVWKEEGPENLGKLVPSFFGAGYSSYNNAPAFDRLGQQNDQQGGRMPGGFFTGDAATKPVVDELARIEAATGKELYKPVSKKDVKDFQMTDEQFYNYQYYAGAYIREDLKQVFASPEYQQASEEDKIKMVREVVKDQKANARDLLFPKQ